jgi:hypothetical protein
MLQAVGLLTNSEADDMIRSGEALTFFGSWSSISLVSLATSRSASSKAFTDTLGTISAT